MLGFPARILGLPTFWEIDAGMNVFLRHSALAAVAMLVLCTGCSTAPRQPSAKPVPAEARSVEDEVALRLTRLTDDLIHRRTPRVLGAISDAYKDDAGRDFEAVKQFLGNAFRDYREIRITRTPPKITVQGAEARSTETLGVIGEPDSNKVSPLNFQGNVSVTLRQVDKTWLITKVQIIR